jgi:drug/metabolite transporter (DMT)-like permease
MGPALIPIAAVLLLDEHISVLGAIGIALVVLGIYAVHLESGLLSELRHPLRTLTSPETQMALLTGVLIAAYSVWDKAALDHLSPVTLNGFSMAGHMLVLTPLALYIGGAAGIRDEWRSHGRTAVLAGILAPVGYLMVLAALTTSRISYVAPAREVGIVLGAAMGVLLLHEGYGPARIAGAALIVGGVITLAVAP